MQLSDDDDEMTVMIMTMMMMTMMIMTMTMMTMMMMMTMNKAATITEQGPVVQNLDNSFAG